MLPTNALLNAYVGRLQNQLRPAVLGDADVLEIALFLLAVAKGTVDVPKPDGGRDTHNEQDQKKFIEEAKEKLQRLENDRVLIFSNEIEVAKKLLAEIGSATIQPETWLGNPGQPWYPLPQEVADLICELAEIPADAGVYAPWDNFGQLAIRVARMGANATVETPVNFGQLIIGQLLTDTHFKVVHSEPILNSLAQDTAGPRIFDSAIAVPPMGVSYKYVEAFGKSTSSTILGINHVLKHAKRRAVVLVPSSFLSNSGADERLRRNLLSDGIVQAVIELPQGVLGTIIQTSVLVLNPQGGEEVVRFVDATSQKFHERASKALSKLVEVSQIVRLALNRTTSSDAIPSCREVPVEDVLSMNSNLQARRYVQSTTAIEANSMLRAGKSVSLGELVVHVSSLPMAAITNRSDESHVRKVRAIGTQDIQTYGFIDSVGKTIQLAEEVFDKHRHLLLRPLDVVLVVKGSVGKVGILSEEVFAQGDIFAGQAVVALRFKNPRDVSAKALYATLRSPLGKELLAALVAGTATPLIQLRELLQLQLPVLTEEQLGLAAAMVDEEQTIQEKIDQLRKQQATLSADFLALEEGEST